VKKIKNVGVAFVLGLLLSSGTLAQQAAQKPTPQAPATQGNQPAKPGPAQKTAKQGATPATRQPQQAQPWAKIPIPPLPAFKPVIPKRIELDNGMVVFLQEDHELPLISASMSIRGGARLEPPEKIGLVDIYGEAWRTGGTKTMTGDQMDDFLEMRAAKIETDGSADLTSISLNCLKGDFAEVFSLFLDLLRNPAFREDKVELAKEQLNTSIARRNDDVEGIARREARILAYGRNNPYARLPEYATVAAVTREDLLKWHQQFVQPNNIILGVVGDFDSAKMEAKLRQAFASWPRGSAAPKPDLKFEPAAPGFYYAPKEDVNQSSIRMVTLGIERSNPDYFAVAVMNEVLGGGMSSRLFKNIRTRQGLAYNVGGGVGAAYDHPGITAIGLGTKSPSTADAIKALNVQILELLQDPATAEELKLAKDSILNSFIFSIDSPAKVLHERMAYEFYGYPLDFLERFRAGVEKVGIEDVARVARKYVKPGAFAVLVVGNDEANKLLASLGPVKKLDISIPPPPSMEAEAAASKSSASSPPAKPH
jgi:zinc protease